MHRRRAKKMMRMRRGGIWMKRMRDADDEGDGGEEEQWGWLVMRMLDDRGVNLFS